MSQQVRTATSRKDHHCPPHVSSLARIDSHPSKNAEHCPFHFSQSPPTCMHPRFPPLPSKPTGFNNNHNRSQKPPLSVSLSTMPPAILLLLLLLTITCGSTATTSSSTTDYLKLPLKRTTRGFPSLQQALALDTLRLSTPVVSGASAGSGQYLVDIRIGTPPQPLRLVADTGSDLVWARCSPCRLCPPRLHPPGSAFLPRRSSSFSPFHCYHPACRLLPHPSPPSTCPSTRLHSPCRYRYAYADRSSSAGFFARESLSAAPRRGLPGLRFGCAFNVSAGPGLRAARGVLGLGRGPISFPSQAARRLRLPDRFSYCLADYTLAPPFTSYLLVGAASPTTNTTTLLYTPLQTNPLSPTFYYVRILGVSVDGKRLPIDPSVFALDPVTGAGGTIVDSGTTLSFLPASAYINVVSAMRRRLPAASVVPGPAGFDLCVNASAVKRIPRLTLAMLGGEVLAPPAGNYFVDAAEGVRCLAVQPVAGGGFGVIGNLMQQGFLLVFDRDADRLGFVQTGCGAE